MGTSTTRFGVEEAMGLLLASVIALAQGGSAQAAPNLGIGSPAPKLVVEKWVRGTEVKEFEKGKVYVVEFWATWCGPCIASMPHLSDLSEKYKGKAQFIGVNVWDRQEDEKTANNAKQMKRITDFMKEKEKEMRYDVVMDGPDDYMSVNWLQAAGQNGIPSSFIIKDNTVAWIGHPATMDKPLEEIVAGTWDIAKAKSDFDAQAAIQKKQMEEFRAWSKKLADTAAANDMPGFLELAGKSPAGANYPVFAAIQTIIGSHPSFALKAMEEKASAIEPNILASMCAYVAFSEKATEADKTKAVSMANAAAEKADKTLKTETYAMVARASVGAKKNADAREAIKKARAHLGDADPAHKDGLSKFVDNVEKMIKD